MPETMRAWAISIPCWDGDKPLILTMATTRGKAIQRNLLASQDAGYGLKFTDFRATRRPEYDKAFQKHGMFSWDWDSAMARLADGSWRAERDIAAMRERLEHANKLIEVIAAHGRRFFWSESRQRTARLDLTLGCVFFTDAYTGKLICTATEGRWDGFSNGGTLKALVEDMRDYIVDGERIARWKIVMPRHDDTLEDNIWGYSGEAAKAVREAAFALPIIAAEREAEAA